MSRIQEDFIKLSREKSVPTSRLDQNEVITAMAALRDKFCDPRKRSDPLWEAVRESRSYYQADGAAFLAKFLGGDPREILILIYDWHGMTGVRTAQSHRIPELLQDMPSFVWYITDPEFDFLLCHNDHEFVIFAD